MLSLSRRTQETIRIGKHIRLTVLKIGRDSVRIGIVAPRNVAVDREEVFLRKRSTPTKVELQDEDPEHELLGRVDVCAISLGGELRNLAGEHSPLAALIALAWHANAAWKLCIGAEESADEKARLVIGALEKLQVDPVFLREWVRKPR